MGRIDTASLAYEQSVLKTSPAVARVHSNIHDSITNWCVALVCWPNPAGLPAAPKALAGARGAGHNFRIELTLAHWGCFAPLDGSTVPMFLRTRIVELLSPSQRARGLLA
jgi:hypothetical protein